jgi:MFS family permease
VTIRSLGRVDSLRSFRHRNFRLFFTGQAISLVGSWMQAVAQAWLILTLTNDPLMLGLVAAAQWTPVLVLGLFGGLIADALPKRRTLVVVESLMGLLAIVLGVLTLTGIVQVWMVLVLAVLLGCLNAVEMPVRQSFAVEMVGRSDVVNAIALNSATFNGARVIGPAVAGLAIAAFDISIAFILNGLSYVAVIVALLLMHEDEFYGSPPIPRPRSARAVVASLGEGLSYVRVTPAVLLPTVVVGLAATIGMNFQVTIPPFARDVLGGDAAAFGFLMAASGLGSIVAALFLATRKAPSAWAIGVGAALLGFGLIATAAVPSYAVAIPALAIAGFGAIWMAANANTLIQTTVPDELRGRVMSVYTTIFAGSTPVGAIFAGALASGWGAVAALAVGGVLTAVVGGIALVWLRRHPIVVGGVVARREVGVPVVPGPMSPAPVPPAVQVAASPASIGTLIEGPAGGALTRPEPRA